MAELCETQADKTGTVNPPHSIEDFVEVPVSVGLPYTQRKSSDAQVPAFVHLNLENLKCFEVVATQFQQWGVRFSNAIALHPSNPAYPTRSGEIVLMGAPRSGWLEVVFDRPALFVRGFVTSSRQTVLTAYNQDGIALAQIETSGSNLAGSDSSIPPNAELSLQVPNIHRVVFRSFDGELTLDDFGFQF